MKKYTRVVKIGGKWNAYLEIGNQGFCFCEQTTKKRAQWHAKMLRHALKNLVEMEIKSGRGHDSPAYNETEVAKLCQSLD